jgi:hypothetical protein
MRLKLRRKFLKQKNENQWIVNFITFTKYFITNAYRRKMKFVLLEIDKENYLKNFLMV